MGKSWLWVLWSSSRESATLLYLQPPDFPWIHCILAWINYDELCFDRKAGEWTLATCFGTVVWMPKQLLTGSPAFHILSWEFSYLGYFDLFWDRLFYAKRKVESIREDHSSIRSLLFRWTQQSDEWQKPQHGTQAARSGVTNRSGSMAEDMVTMLASLVEEVLSILLFFSIWRVWKLCPLTAD